MKPDLDKIERALSSARMTQTAIARKMGVTDAALSNWRRHMRHPTPANLAKLAEVRNWSPQEADRLTTDAFFGLFHAIPRP